MHTRQEIREQESKAVDGPPNTTSIPHTALSWPTTITQSRSGTKVRKELFELFEVVRKDHTRKVLISFGREWNRVHRGNPEAVGNYSRACKPSHSNLLLQSRAWLDSLRFLRMYVRARSKPLPHDPPPYERLHSIDGSLHAILQHARRSPSSCQV